MLYVPTEAEIENMIFIPLTDAQGKEQTAAAQAAALNTFIEQDKYLSGLRGHHTTKYGRETPWYSQLDLRILQDFNFINNGKTKTVQISLDFVNLGNLVNSHWGIREYASTTGYYQPIVYKGLDATGKANYQFDPSQKATFITSPDLISRWQLQVGLRYSF